MTYYQCNLAKPNETGITMMRTWIEKRGAKVGNKVELIMDDGTKEWWTVYGVSDTGIEKFALSEHQRYSRNSLPSIINN